MESEPDRPGVLPAPEANGRRDRAATAVLALGALGVVYGDIGTNPLFAMREAFTAHRLAIDEPNVLGLLSLAFWSLIVVISVKYVTFILRASNEGEGGILALAALIQGPQRREAGRRRVLVLLGVVGAALLFGDGIITPRSRCSRPLRARPSRRRASIASSFQSRWRSWSRCSSSSSAAPRRLAGCSGR